MAPEAFFAFVQAHADAQVTAFSIADMPVALD
jgi:hypothetical protein